ncbi:hypothetical protein PM082_006336 [Marasmius tenuissimus]|nr:hypothetical protein PM082_006336 [Marasmius tenuissimus]
MICQGPQGPDPDIDWAGDNLEIKNLPSTIDFLEEDVFLRFLASCKSKKVDRAFVGFISWAWDSEIVPQSFHRPTVFSIQTGAPIAFANNDWDIYETNLTEKKVLDNGYTRFRLFDEDDGNWLLLGMNWNAGEAWTAQAPSIFHSQGTSLEDSGDFRFVWREALLEGPLSVSPSEFQRQHKQSLYLFVCLPPPDFLSGNTSSLHFWSFNDDGQSPISHTACVDFGLPIELDFRDAGFRLWSWSTEHYKLGHRYQHLRAFDPTTTNFVRHLGLNHYTSQPTNDLDRFEEILGGRGSVHPQSSLTINFDKSITAEGLSNTQGERSTEISFSQGTVETRRVTSATSSGRDVANQRQCTDMVYEGTSTGHALQPLHWAGESTSESQTKKKSTQRHGNQFKETGTPIIGPTSILSESCHSPDQDLCPSSEDCSRTCPVGDGFSYAHQGSHPQPRLYPPGTLSSGPTSSNMSSGVEVPTTDKIAKYPSTSKFDLYSSTGMATIGNRNKSRAPTDTNITASNAHFPPTTGWTGVTQIARKDEPRRLSSWGLDEAVDPPYHTSLSSDSSDVNRLCVLFGRLKLT